MLLLLRLIDWGLRKYDGDQDRVWGGDSECVHEWGDLIKRTHEGGGNSGVPIEWQRPSRASHTGGNSGQYCQLCGAWSGAFGLEPTPELYVEHTVEFLRAIRRVLRKDGVVMWNVGDSYYASNRSDNRDVETKKKQGASVGASYNSIKYLPQDNTFTADYLKPKDLCLIPFRVAIAAQQDGWYIRSIIIWAKPNPMPESVKDRPTDAHEYIIMMTKSSKYYWDMDAVREAYTEPMNRWGGETLKRDTSKTSEYKDMMNIGNTSAFRVGRPMRPNESGRNLRSVWTFPTTPYPEAHFAVFPPELPKRCILAATSEKGECSKCGKPWVRAVEISREYRSGSGKAGNKANGKYADREDCIGDLEDDIRSGPCVLSKTIGWQPQCSCNAPTVPQLVLDPFAGSGTVGEVAKSLGRKAILIDASEKYCQLAVKRVQAITIPMRIE